MNRILIVGGDMRFVYLARLLEEKGCSVTVKGTGAATIKKSTLPLGEEAMLEEVFILPLPYTTDGITINTPLCDECLYLREIWDNTRDDALIFGGVVCEKHNEYPKNFYDYAKRDDFAIRNAVPTAEGAIEATIKHMNVTVSGSKAVVTGFGRCAKVLSLTLKALGADVTVCARKAGDLAMAEALGMKSVHIKKLCDAVDDADVIFNTVPHGIFKKEELSKIKKDCPLADLASNPGGADRELAKELNVKYLFLPSLPGKYSPCTAAEIIMKTIENIIEEIGKEGTLWNFREKG